MSPLGLTEKLIKKICGAYGSPQTAVEVCTTNPYDLIRKVKGVSFSKADEIARKCALDMTSDNRLEALIFCILEEGAMNGKTYLHSNQLLTRIHDIMFADMMQINKVICKMQREEVVTLIDNGQQISLTRYFELEKNICKELMRLAKAKSNIKVPDNWREIVKELEEEQGWQHTDEQWHGIETVLNSNITVVTGKAGTGKSTVTNAMTRVLNDYTIKLTCLSAKASQRIEEVTGRPASTIHRLLGLGINKDEQYQNVDPIVLTDILIIDESSMVNGYLFLKLLKALQDGTKLVILGDDGQLQAIGECSVFSDLLTTDKLPIIHLSKIHRQAQKSAIITKSIAVRNQEEIYPKGFVGHMTLGELQDLELYIQKEREGLVEEIVKSFTKELNKRNGNVMEVQVISAMKTRGDIGTYKLNKILQKIYNRCNSTSYTTEDNVEIFVGDKVINTKNNYKTKTVNGEECPIFNGNIGIVNNITSNTIEVDFNGIIIEFEKKDRDALNLAYAITTHSSQGSQWESVIVAFDSSAWLLLTVEMLYTAITRASNHCILIAEDKSIKQAIRTVEQKTKQTYLSRFLECVQM